MSQDDNPHKSKRSDVDDRLYSPSAARNRDIIRDTFLAHMPTTGHILEVGAGSGEHGVHIAAHAPDLTWHSGDPDPEARRSINAWIKACGLANMPAPHHIDASHPEWEIDETTPFGGIVSINMIHIAPFGAAIGLFTGAGRLLGPGGKLFLYGPFSRNGTQTAASNEAFDASLKSRDPRWGIRDIEQDLVPLSNKNALHLATLVEMPANNLTLIFEKTS